MRRRDPAKRVIWAAGLLIASMLVWSSSLFLRGMLANRDLGTVQSQMILAPPVSACLDNQKKAAEIK